MNTDLMNRVEAASGRLEKEALLRTADDDTKEFIRLAVDTYVKFGVRWQGSEDADNPLWDIFIKTDEKRTRWWGSFRALLQKFATRELTGNIAKEELTELMVISPTRDDYVWAARVLNKDLRCGVSKSIVKKIWPGLIDPFAVSLAEEYDPTKHTPARLGPVFVGPKLDGLRVVVVKGVPYSRNGRVFENVLPIVEELAWFTNVRDWVFDGEVIDPGRTFEETIGNARRSGSGGTLRYHIFDMVDITEWEERSTRTLSSRKLDLRSLSETMERAGGSAHVRVIDEHLVESPDHEVLTQMLRIFLDAGHEGAMIKRDAPYRFKRTEDVLKMKLFETVDATVTGFTEGRGRHRGSLGALLIRLPNGKDTRCGSGFSDEERDAIWATKTIHEGKTVEVQYQNMTAHGKTRFPTFVRFRPDKDPT